MRYLKYSLLVVLVLSVAGIISCSGRSGNKETINNPVEPEAAAVQVKKSITLNTPEADSRFRTGDLIRIEIEPFNAGSAHDSVVMFFNGQKVAVIAKGQWTYDYRTGSNSKTGRSSIKLMAYSDSQNPQVVTRFVTLLSDIDAEVGKFRIVNTYPHDREAYTQGLVYADNVLYEGTGIIGRSDLRKTELNTGRIIKQQKIDNQLFGEGIAILNDKLYQLTWTSGVGFIYKKDSFELINKFSYATEGWGLSVYGDKLVMSDGSNQLYFIDPELFTVVSTIEVFDNENAVDKLNELEVINGEIWANIYTTDRVARIDPLTGKVLGYIDFSGLLPQTDREPETEVLNGIAYDKDLDRIFITGKFWPKLFEVKITE